MARKVSMKDIASSLNITVDAVSKALRDSPRISQATKKLVLEKAEELGYVKNSLAASLRYGTTNFVAVCINSLLNPFFAILTTKIFIILRNYGYSGILCFCDRHLLSKEYLTPVFNNNCCAVISLVEPSEDAVEMLKKNNIPIFAIGMTCRNKFVNYVVTDDFAGGKLVGEYFTEHNYQKALYITDSLSNTSRKRQDGFNEGAKLDSEKSITSIQSTPEKDMSDEVVRIIEEQGIDFVFCFSDYLASKVVHWINGSKAKSNIKIIGYDSIYKYDNYFQNIASVGYDMDAIAEYTVRKTIEILNSGHEPSKRITKVFPVCLNDSTLKHIRMN